MRYCFTGHRRLSLEETQVIQCELLSVIETLLADGEPCQFLAGGALGFDTIAAETVLFFRETYPWIRLILVLPCHNQTKGWPQKEIARYEQICSQADEIIYTSQSYYEGCMFCRDRYLAEHSDVCIAFLRPDMQKGGTRYTVNYCLEKGVSVVNIAERRLILSSKSKAGL